MSAGEIEEYVADNNLNASAKAGIYNYINGSVSLNSNVNGNSNTELIETIQSTKTPNPESECINNWENKELASAVNCLNTNKKNIICSLYGLGGISQKIGVSEATVAYYVNGRRIPNLSSAYKIASALDCSIDELTGVSDAYHTTNSDVKNTALISLYSLLNSEGQRQMYESLDNITHNPKNIDLQSKEKIEEIHDVVMRLNPVKKLS